MLKEILKNIEEDKLPQSTITNPIGEQVQKFCEQLYQLQNSANILLNESVDSKESLIRNEKKLDNILLKTDKLFTTVLKFVYSKKNENSSLQKESNLFKSQIASLEEESLNNLLLKFFNLYELNYSQTIKDLDLHFKKEKTFKSFLIYFKEKFKVL